MLTCKEAYFAHPREPLHDLLASPSQLLTPDHYKCKEGTHSKVLAQGFQVEDFSGQLFQISVVHNGEEVRQEVEGHWQKEHGL